MIIAQVAVPGPRRRHRGQPDRADQGRRAGPAGRVRRSDGPRRVDHHRQEGHHPVSEQSASTDTEGRRPVRRALVSVYDKTGLEELATALHAAGVAIVSTGSTAARIAAAGVPVTPVEELTGFPECLDGRVKTLHPRVHAGLLADVGNPDHVAQLTDLDIEPFELVVSNLYPSATPFGRVRARPSASSRSTSAARRWSAGRPRTTPTSRSSSRRTGTPRCWKPLRRAASPWPSASGSPPRRSPTPRRTTSPWRPGWAACWRRRPTARGSRTGPARRGRSGTSCATARTRTSGPRSTRTGARGSRRPRFCTARRCPTTTTSTPTPRSGRRSGSSSRRSRSSSTPTRAASPWPVGRRRDADIAQAHAKAHACDPVSAYGGVVAANRPVTLAMAEQLAEVFTEVVAAPAFDDDAYRAAVGEEEHPPARAAGGLGAGSR